MIEFKYGWARVGMSILHSVLRIPRRMHTYIMAQQADLSNMEKHATRKKKNYLWLNKKY